MILIFFKAIFEAIDSFVIIKKIITIFISSDNIMFILLKSLLVDDVIEKFIRIYTLLSVYIIIIEIICKISLF